MGNWGKRFGSANKFASWASMRPREEKTAKTRENVKTELGQVESSGKGFEEESEEEDVWCRETRYESWLMDIQNGETQGGPYCALWPPCHMEGCFLYVHPYLYTVPSLPGALALPSRLSSSPKAVKQTAFSCGSSFVCVCQCRETQDATAII